MNGASCNSLSRRGRVLYLGGRCVSGGRASTKRDLGEGGFGVTRGSSGVVHLMAFSGCRGIRRTSLECDDWWHIVSTPLRCFTLSDQVSRPDLKSQPSVATRWAIILSSGESYPPSRATVSDETHILATRSHRRASSFDGTHRLRLCLVRSHLQGRLSFTADSGRPPSGRWHRATQPDRSPASSADSRSVCTRKQQNIKIDSIELEPSNPRIKQFMTMYLEFTEARMLLAVGEGVDYLDGEKKGGGEYC